MTNASKNLDNLRVNPYPGRGIVLGHNKRGSIIQIYWMMGRSESSRNRIFVKKKNIIQTNLFNKNYSGDISLIIYNALNNVGDLHVVSNGDQTDTIIDYLKKDKVGGFGKALKTRTFEPDKPTFTPRISGVSNVKTNKNILSIIKRGKNGKPVHKFWNLKDKPGIGDCIHTYKSDGSPLPSFEGKPYPVPIPDTIDEIADTYWEVLNDDNKVALVVKMIDKKTGKVDLRIKNKLV